MQQQQHKMTLLSFQMTRPRAWHEDELAGGEVGDGGEMTLRIGGEDQKGAYFQSNCTRNMMKIGVGILVMLCLILGGNSFELVRLLTGGKGLGCLTELGLAGKNETMSGNVTAQH